MSDPQPGTISERSFYTQKIRAEGDRRRRQKKEKRSRRPSGTSVPLSVRVKRI